MKTLFLALLMTFSPFALVAQATGEQVVEFYYSDDCPHCQEAKPFLEKLAADNPLIVLRQYEVWYDGANLERLTERARVAGYVPDALPNIFIGDRHWVGFNESVGQEIRAYLEGLGSLSGTPPRQFELPFLGPIHLEGQGIVLITLAIGFVDGVNPCSLWVLSILLSLVLHSGSRRKVATIGLVFLGVSTLIYGLFLIGMFSLARLIQFSGWLPLAVAFLAVILGSISIKDYFWFQNGPSLSIPDRAKPGIFRQIRQLIDPGRSFGALLVGTSALAAGVSVVELGCTAGFPLLWTQLVAEKHVSPFEFAGLLGLYLIAYQVLSLVVFLAAVYGLKASRLEEKQGRFLKLLGGSLLVTLAVVMAIKPDLLNAPQNALAIFGLVLVVVLLVHSLSRRFLNLGTKRRR